MPNTTISFTYNDTNDFSPIETLLYYMQVDEESAAFNAAIKENDFYQPEEILPGKDRTKRASRRKERARIIRKRDRLYKDVADMNYGEWYPTGQLADGKGKIFEGDSKFARSFKKINPSWNEEKTDATAREALKEFYKSEGNLSYESINDSDWEYDEGWCDLEYEQEYRLEAEREMMLDEIRNVKTVARAVYLAARFGEEIAWNETYEYGDPDYANLYREGVELLAEEMTLREDQANSYIKALEDFTWR